MDFEVISYFHKSSLESGKTADMAEKKKIHNKYRHLANDFHFIPIETETQSSSLKT